MLTRGRNGPCTVGPVRTRTWRAGAVPRSTAALVVAAVAVALAAAGAFAPARKLEAHFSWPPRTLPAAQPTRTWYAPLLITRHTPAELSARIPCGGQGLADAAHPLVLLATKRDPYAAGALAVTRANNELSVTIGGASLAHVAIPNRGCMFTLSLADDSWSLSGGGTIKNGTAAMPDVDGLFSGLDLRAGPRPAVEITTDVFGTRATVAQDVLRILALICALAALALVVRPVVRRPGLGRPRIVDGVVVVLLLVWWVIGPAYFDDGWIMAGQRNFLATGNFSAYYDSFGVTTSVQYWLLWLQHFFFDASDSLLVLRIPALVCLVATWFMCRWILGRTAAARSSVALWSLAATFCVGAFAWGMTLRPEPEVALLVLGVVACVVAFLQRGTTAPLVLASLLVALAVTAHPAGLLSIAPLIVAAPAVIAWIRKNRALAGTIILATLAVAGVLTFLGTDLAQFRSNVDSLRSHGAETAGWRDELTRYELLARPLYGPPMRRAWVAIAVLAVLASVLRRRRSDEDALLNLFAPALGIGLLLLIVTPAKIPWHFGTLLGLAALAAAAESARLVGRGWHVRPFIVVGAAMVAAAWSWFPRNTWSDLDLRTLDWTLGFEHRVTLAKLAGLAPLVLLGVFALLARRLDVGAWRAAAWTVPVLAVPLIAFTFGVLIVDAKKTSSWTLTRQNLDSLRGDLRCGLADDAVVPSLKSMSTYLADQTRYEFVGPAPAHSRWFRIPRDTRFGFLATGDTGGDSLRVEWGTNGRALSSDPVSDASLGDPSPQLVAWRFFPSGSLPPRPANADEMRIALDSPVSPGGNVGVVAPVPYHDVPLGQLLTQSAPVLVLPNLRAYVPCVKQPTLHGTADVPKLLIGQLGTLWPVGTGSSPFDGLPEVYNLVRLPLTDSAHPPGDVAVYQVNPFLRGGVVAPVE